MTLVRVLLGVIGALLKAFTGAFVALLHAPVVMACVLVLLVAAGFALCGACGIGTLRNRR